MMNTPTTPKDTLLVIDDAPDNVKILLGFLGHAGFKVLAAKDGEHGLKLAEHTYPDVILLDIMMPGIDEVCRRLELSGI
jgi:CheY-like chemotaxis protein